MNGTQEKDRRGENGLALIVGGVLGMILGGGLVAGISGWLWYVQEEAASVNATVPSPAYSNGAANSVPTGMPAPAAGSSYSVPASMPSPAPVSPYRDSTPYPASPASEYGSPYNATTSYEESSAAAVDEADTTVEIVDPETADARSSPEKESPKAGKKDAPDESSRD